MTFLCAPTWFTSPHVAEDLYMTGDLFLAAFNAKLLEMVDQELVPPTAAAAGISCPRRLPVFLETYKLKMRDGIDI